MHYSVRMSQSGHGWRGRLLGNGFSCSVWLSPAQKSIRISIGANTLQILCFFLNCVNLKLFMTVHQCSVAFMCTCGCKRILYPSGWDICVNLLWVEQQHLKPYRLASFWYRLSVFVLIGLTWRRLHRPAARLLFTWHLFNAADWAHKKVID